MLKGNLHLDPIVELKLGTEVMNNLKRELNFLLEVYLLDGADDKRPNDETEQTPSKEMLEGSWEETKGSKSYSIPGAPDHAAVSASMDRQRTQSASSTEKHASKSTTISFTSRVGPQDKNAFAAEVLEIINTATSLF